MKIVFFETEPGDEERVRELQMNHEVQLMENPLMSDSVEVARGAEIISVFVDSRITAEMLTSLSAEGLKIIATRSTGFDHIDGVKAAELGILIVNVPSYGENTVAEHAMALLLTISRKLYQNIDRTEHGNYSLKGLRGFDLMGKTIGIYGLGKIGGYVVRMAHGFGMKILAYARTPDDELTKLYGVEYVDGIDALVARSDVLSLHCPLTPQTTHLINRDLLPRIKKGLVLINTSRGGLVETEALVEALDNDIISAAGLDVMEEEVPMKEAYKMYDPVFREKIDVVTLMANHVLIGRDDVVFTAHNAFNSIEAVNRIWETTLGNIVGYVSGATQNVVGIKQ